MSDTATKNPLLLATIRVSKDIVYRDFPSETVVLNVATGQYHGLNTTAGEMLAALDQTGSVEAAAKQLAERHEVDVATVQADVCALCEKLSERGLIEIEPAASQ